MPPGGWNAQNFATRNGQRLVVDFVNVKRSAQARGMRVMSAYLAKYFRQQIEAVCAHAVAHAERTGHKAAGDYAPIVFNFGANEQIWAEALKAIFGAEADIEIVTATMPLYQSVIDETMQKTSGLIGEDVTRAMSNGATRRAQEMCKKVTRINDTTRDRLRATIEDGLANQLNVYEMTKSIRARVPEIATNRIPTIARTEMGNAVDAGSKETFANSRAVTYVSVVGCEAIEPGIPTWHGVPTCNIQNVPAHAVNELEFHINHTGCIVPSGFRNDDGSAEHYATEEGDPKDNSRLPSAMQEDGE